MSPQNHFYQFLTHLGLDPEIEPELRESPKRVSEFYQEFLVQGSPEATPTPSLFPCDEDAGMVAVTDLDFYSLCAHHFLPFFGKAHVLYKPNKKLIGFSGIAEIVLHLSHRLTLQEYLTDFIHNRLKELLNPKGLLIALEARQLCMEMRGVKSQGNIVSLKSSGTLKELETTGKFQAYFKLG